MALALVAPGAFAQWSYYLVDKTMAGPPSPNWTTSNGLGTDMLVSPPSSDYGAEVRAVISNSSQGYLEIYLAAIDCYNGCQLDGASNFTAGYEVVMSTGGGITLYNTWVNFTGYPSYAEQVQLTYELSSPALPAGTAVRAITRSDSAGGSDIIVYVNNSLVLFYHDTSSQATFGGPVGFNFPDGTATDYVSEGDAAALYSGAPSAISESSIGVSTTTNSVDLQWPASSEPNGPGVYGYLISRNGTALTGTPVTCTCYSDLTTSPNSTYTYTITAVDYHWNKTSTNITVNTPLIPSKGPYPSATPNGYRTGVQPTGTYWGMTNENIDVMSGNLSFSVPLLKAQARTNWTVPFNLSYNSQAWRQDSGGEWALAGDVGEGFGWRLLAGAVTPVESGGTISFYLFTDASGAEYRLDQNNNNIWSSVDSVYVYYDANLDILHFRDGSFWTMGCVSSASEFDSGVMYPTKMEDTNGNQILISYNPGAGSQYTNSSSRINVIQDVRSTTNSSTFSFSYNSDSPVPHLTGITNSISTGEQYTFSYAENQTVSSPINGQSFGETTFLNSTTVNGLGVVTSFSYDGSGELTQAVVPNGGYLKWDYDTVTYSSGISFREVNHRYLSKDGTTGSQTTYTLSHESSVSTPVHQYTQLADPSGTGEKYWAIGQSGVGMGLVTEYQGIQLPGSVVKAQNNFTWSLDGVGNSYISSTQATLDPSQTYQAQSQTTQSVDNYGNVTQVNYYNYGNLSTPYRSYYYSYVNSSAYTSLYIFNRLLNASVTSGGTNYPLASNTYDYSTQYNCWYSTVTNPGSNWDTNYANQNTRGDMTQSTTPSGISSYCYNQLGVNTTVTTNGVTTTVTTSDSNSYAAPTALSVGSLTTNLGWSSFLGLANDTGPNGDSSSTYYDQFARQTSTTSPFGATTSYTYSSAPYTSSNPEVITSSINAASGTRWSSNTLDGLGRTITAKSGYGSTTTSQVDTTYGSCACSPGGKMMAQSLLHAPGASVAWTTYTYDGIGRTISVLAPDGASTTTYLYQGNTVQVTDPAGKWKLFTLDVMGNLTQVTEPNPSDGAPPTSTRVPANV